MEAFVVSAGFGGRREGCRVVGRTGVGSVRMSMDCSRREVLRLSGVLGLGLVAPNAAFAKVNVDIDRYGDKEMKVSTINRLKQNLRTALGDNPLLLPAFIMLPVLDALSYDKSTAGGGLDGAFSYEIGSSDNAVLVDAYETIKGYRQKSKEEVSTADYFAFAGAVASEVVGGPRIVIQIGREDAEEKDTSGIYKTLSASSGYQAFKAALDRSGRDGARDAVVFHTAIQALAQIAEKRNEELQARAVDEDDLDSESVFKDKGDLTYGAVGGSGQPAGARKRRGAVLVDSQISNLQIAGSKLDSSYLKEVLNAQKKNPDSLSQFDKDMLADPASAGWVAKYASNSKAFIKDFANSYEALSLVGSRFEQAKIRDD
ncbi:hypothetical protein NDN08_007354 [Rhodosorus marinus]|uniref:Plant heme peroxidase family profile domain-containing protein n=1 Tax=Rhodosorus marinus TaxID=101924 RepID=A0AAV8UGA0_9RHOD|nr:hypothetical protein NDN08_007354 [Rhodosorus marinus]